MLLTKKMNGGNNMKYNEDKILNEIGDYIKGTYANTMLQVSKGTQVQDLLRDIGIDKDFCQIKCN